MTDTTRGNFKAFLNALALCTIAVSLGECSTLSSCLEQFVLQSRVGRIVQIIGVRCSDS